MAGLRDLLARPVDTRSLELFTVHLMGTARMSQDPRRGVTALSTRNAQRLIEHRSEHGL